MNNTQFTRKQLYDLVWSKSLTQLAKEYSISDNGLRKICKKHNIPLPKMGHWQKMQYGKKLEIIPLPKVADNKEIQIYLDERETEGKEEHILSKLARISKEIETGYPSFIEVPEKLIKPDILVREARKDLRTKKASNWRNHKECIYTSTGVLSISVEKQNVLRILCIADTFIKLLRKRGHEIIIEGNETKIIVDDERYKIRFREKHTRESYKDGNWTRSDLIPNGKLSIKFDDLYDKEWADKATPLEKQLSKVIAFFEIRAIQDKEQRERWRIAREESDRQREIERKLQAIREWEEKKVQMLLEHSSQWHKAKDLNEFIQEVEAKSTNPTQEVKDWLKWAKEKQDQLDPLSKGSESLIDKYLTPPVPPKKNYFY